MTPAEQRKLIQIEAYEAARKSISGADEIIDTALELDQQLAAEGEPVSREVRVATLAKLLITYGQGADKHAIHIVAARAIDRLIEQAKGSK